MASDVTTSAQFATQNMKPAPGEQADAIWAQKVADNTGYAIFRHMHGPSVNVQWVNDSSGIGGYDGTWRGTHFYRKDAAYGTIYGSYVMIDAGGNGGVEFFVNNTSVLARNSTGSGYLAGSFIYGIGGQTDGNMYEFTYHFKTHNAVEANRYSLNVTTFFKP